MGERTAGLTVDGGVIRLGLLVVTLRGLAGHGRQGKGLSSHHTLSDRERERDGEENRERESE